MKSIKFEAQLRTELGKRSTRQLRSEGLVPGVIYGKENINFAAKPLDLRHLVYTSEFQIAEITIAGKEYRCILKDKQFDVLTDDLNHIDFLELVEDRKVIANLPLKFVGQPEGVKAGGRLNIKAKTLKVRTLPKNLVESIEVDISGLNLNDNLRVEDVQVGDMEVMNSPRIPVASVVLTRALRQAGTEDAKTTSDSDEA